ncbi:arginase family protein [uncultured Parabacteroides sp.]|mgnify:FL=1|uniref:arginase family protein n=1 Tax=uncultured Parabacteroides sp. TaxID=512312 RepID=UPI00258655A9|nr:arginase family protein [uncultured Parabacteroides sp.]
MEKKTSTLRLIYPQWQGGIVAHWMPDIPADDASRGYYLGAQLLNLLAPESSQKTVVVPVSLDINDRKTEKGVSGHRVILEQTKAALAKLRENNPDRIVTLGGECSVSVVPFTYLAEKYPGDVAVVWIDAHPDVNLPYDDYKGYHAMALTACLGMGDEEIMNVLPGKFDASKSLLVGLRSWDEGMKERQKELGIIGFSPAEVAADSTAVLEWLKGTGVSKVVIHFDLDVLDPNEMIAGVGVEPDGMKIQEVVRVINDIAAGYDLVGLTVAEPMPRIAIKIRNMLDQLPLLKE